MKILPWNPEPIQPSRSEPSSSFISIPMSRKPPFRQFFWSIHLDQFFLQNQSDQSFLASLSKCFWIQQLQQWWCCEIGDAGCSQARNPPCKEILGGGSLGNLMGLPSQSSMRVNPPRFPYSSDHLAHLLITPDTDQIQTILVQLKTSLSWSKTLLVLRWLEMIIILCMMIRQRWSEAQWVIMPVILWRRSNWEETVGSAGNIQMQIKIARQEGEDDHLLVREGGMMIRCDV